MKIDNFIIEFYKINNWLNIKCDNERKNFIIDEHIEDNVLEWAKLNFSPHEHIHVLASNVAATYYDFPEATDKQIEELMFGDFNKAARELKLPVPSKFQENLEKIRNFFGVY